VLAGGGRCARRGAWVAGARGRGGIENNDDSNAQRSTTYFQGGCSCRRADSFRGGQTVVWTFETAL